MAENDLARFRTKACRRLHAGGCQFADRCQYSHNEKWPRRCPYLLTEKKPITSALRYLPVYCPDLEMNDGGSLTANNCKRGLRCVFAHTKEEVEFHPLIYKQMLCKSRTAYKKCNRFYCPFAHKKSEIRQSHPYILSIPSERRTASNTLNSSPSFASTTLSEASVASASGENITDLSAANLDASGICTSEWRPDIMDLIPSLAGVWPQRDFGTMTTPEMLTFMEHSDTTDVAASRSLDVGDIAVVSTSWDFSVDGDIDCDSNEENLKWVVSNFSRDPLLNDFDSYTLFEASQRPLNITVGDGLQIIGTNSRGDPNWLICRRFSGHEIGATGCVHKLCLLGNGRARRNQVNVMNRSSHFDEIRFGELNPNIFTNCLNKDSRQSRLEACDTTSSDSSIARLNQNHKNIEFENTYPSQNGEVIQDDVSELFLYGLVNSLARLLEENPIDTEILNREYEYCQNSMLDNDDKLYSSEPDLKPFVGVSHTSIPQDYANRQTLELLAALLNEENHSNEPHTDMEYGERQDALSKLFFQNWC